MIDTHAHLDMHQFDADREDTIRRAAASGVKTIITVATDLVSSHQAIDIAERHEGIYASIGFHPQDARMMKPKDTGELKKLGSHPKVVAVGETGLDYYRMTSPRDIQIQALNKQLEIASGLGLPVIIHSRQAESDTINLLRQWSKTLEPGRIPGVIHCFNGNVNSARTYIDMGFYIAFGAYTGYPSSRIAEAVRSVPADRLLTETDSPFLPPQIHRGKRNEPSYIPIVVELLARFRGETIETIARQTAENARRLFNLPV